MRSSWPDCETGAAEPCTGIPLARRECDGPDPINLGNGQEIAFRDLAGLVGKAPGYKGEGIGDTAYPNGQPRR